MPGRVIILGGGVAGMSAAHELIERGFAVSVFELKAIPGGKARSISVPDTGTLRNIGTVHSGRLGAGKRQNLPGEHGFRFFPRFYKHVIDTMQRIPYRDGTTVADNLVDTRQVELARFGHPRIILPSRFPRSVDDLRTLLESAIELLSPDMGIAWAEKEFFISRIWQILSSCEERRADEYEKIGWWDFIGAETRSAAYQKLFGLGITRSLVASQARVASTKTIGDIFVQLLFDIVQPGVSSDRVLNGPTSVVWLQPWLDYLTARGVDYQLNSRVLSINVAYGRVHSVTIERHGMPVEVQGEYYIAALPVEVMATLISPEMVRADPRLGHIIPLSNNVAWMNGIQLYLTEDVTIAPGHVIHVDSPWALTSISQAQFWPAVDLRQYGDGKVRGIISVDISDWNAPGLYGKAARECTREEIKNEVWETLKRSLNVGGHALLKDAYLHSYFLDPDIDPTLRANSEPLLVNLIDTRRLRPEAVTGLGNLFLASDYVRTYTDLATMEAANEAARRAVNGIITAAGAGAPLCQLWKLHEPDFLQPWRLHDRVRYQQRLPWDDTLITLVFTALRLVNQVAALLGREDAGGVVATAYKTTLLPHLQTLQTRPELLGQWIGSDPAAVRDRLQQLGGLVQPYVEALVSGQGGLEGLGEAVATALARLQETLLSAYSAALSSPDAPQTDPGAEDTRAARRQRVRFVQR